MRKWSFLAHLSFKDAFANIKVITQARENIDHQMRLTSIISLTSFSFSLQMLAAEQSKRKVESKGGSWSGEFIAACSRLNTTYRIKSWGIAFITLLLPFDFMDIFLSPWIAMYDYIILYHLEVHHTRSCIEILCSMYITIRSASAVGKNHNLPSLLFFSMALSNHNFMYHNQTLGHWNYFGEKQIWNKVTG